MRHLDLPLNTRCGERKLCKACLVEVKTDSGWETVHGCQLVLEHDQEIRIPQAALLAYAPQVLSDFRINVSVAQAPPFVAPGLGVAVDIGTTTVAVALVELGTGDVVGRSAGFNRQMNLGDDVLTRINLCTTDPGARAALRAAIVEETLVPLVRQALAEAERNRSEVRGYVLAGNTTMLHLVTGTDPTSLGVAPFTPVFIDHQTRHSHEMGLEPADVPVHLLAGAAAYIGADITAGVFASGLAYDEGPSLLVDVGTNGEIVLKHGDRLLGCATAAGPAFEGSGLTAGVRAGDGAIAHLRLGGSPVKAEIDIIGPGGTRAIGLCGSAYVDYLAEGRRSGLLHASGRLHASAADPEAIGRDEHGQSYRLALGLGKRVIVVKDLDVAKLLQAKAAIAAGISILLQRAGIEADDVKTLYLAGGFGMHLNLTNAIACGLLPGFREDQIQLVGNTSLAGAYLATVDRSVARELGEIGRAMEVVELNLDPDFEDAFIDNLSLP